MLRVSNRRCVRRLGRRAMGAAKVRNLIAILAIALTTTLFTSLFTIAMSLNDGFQRANFRQVGGYAHGGFKYLTEEQFGELKDDPLIKEWGIRRVAGMPRKEPFNKTHVEIGWADENYAHWTYCDPEVGRLPQEGTLEAAVGVPADLPEVGLLEAVVDGHGDGEKGRKEGGRQGDGDNGDQVSHLGRAHGPPAQTADALAVGYAQHRPSPPCDDAPVLDADDAVGHLGQLLIVRDHHDGLAKTLPGHF